MVDVVEISGIGVEVRGGSTLEALDTATNFAKQLGKLVDANPMSEKLDAAGQRVRRYRFVESNRIARFPVGISSSSSTAENDVSDEELEQARQERVNPSTTPFEETAEEEGYTFDPKTEFYVKDGRAFDRWGSQR